MSPCTYACYALLLLNVLASVQTWASGIYVASYFNAAFCIMLTHPIYSHCVAYVVIHIESDFHCTSTYVWYVLLKHQRYSEDNVSPHMHLCQSNEGNLLQTNTPTFSCSYVISHRSVQLFSACHPLVPDAYQTYVTPLSNL